MTTKSKRPAPPVAKKKTAPAAKAPDSLGDLRGNPKNPRKAWKDDAQRAKFLQSLQTFGDLSGIVFNQTTQQLVGGHKRVDEFKLDKGAALSVTERLAKPDASGTVAFGHVTLSDGTRFAYRQVRWDKAKENAANLAANKWGAEWDWESVAGMLDELKLDKFDLELTGFDAKELEFIGQEGFTGFGNGDETGGGESGEEEEEDHPVYSGKIDAPVYTPSGPCPPIDELVGLEKELELLERIEGSGVDGELREFLVVAAARHRVFNYEKIAEYYAHASKEVQKLMEDSALVIIDFNAAVEGGFVLLTERMKRMYLEEYPDGDVDADGLLEEGEEDGESETEE